MSWRKNSGISSHRKLNMSSRFGSLWTVLSERVSIQSRLNRSKGWICRNDCRKLKSAVLTTEEDTLTPCRSDSTGIIVQILHVFASESNKAERRLMNRERTLGDNGFVPCHAGRKRKREQTGERRRQPWMGHPALEVDWIDGEP